MKCGTSNSDIIHKEVLIIGNGPSGIAMSYMLSGNLPYVVSNLHPDEFLSARLAPIVGQSLVHQHLGHLAAGLEGRTTNPVSLLLDSLMNPYADIGLEIESLIEWRKDGPQIDHVVLGKGPPGGSWHSMDPHILTLSLGSWMSLPGLRYEARDGSEKRASAKHVAEYYVRYVKEMGLEDNFKNHVVVTSIKPCECKSKWVEKVHSDIGQKVKLCSRPEPKDKRKSSCTLTNALNYIMSRGKFGDENYDSYVTKVDRKSCDSFKPKVPNKFYCDSSKRPKWVVEAYDLKTRTSFTYTCNQLVLANGSSDLPNRLSISNNSDPYWLLHDLRSLEIELDLHLRNERSIDPVLIVGAGLSAADAIIATRAKNVPVIHVFRNGATNLSKQLPENMYPEYHKVHQMMKQGSNYTLYSAYSEYTVDSFNEVKRTAVLRSQDGKAIEVKVSFAAVLIGSRPDLTFLPETYNLATKKNLPIDCKKNTVNVNRLKHSVNGFDGLYAIGPLAGDNFVRFLPGGALAILSDLYERNGFRRN